ncbi:ARMT1-like domain-containing protein, partial [Microbispora hainanensis]
MSGARDETVVEALPTPPPIMGNVPGSYALSVFRERHPVLVRQVAEALPYPPDRRRALDRLLDEVVRDVMEPLEPSAHDAAAWAEWGHGKIGRPYADVPFLWGESYFYRKVLDATGYFGDGPWRGVDPFGPMKQAELGGPVVDGELAALDDTAALSPAERADALLLGSLWGNRADLSFGVTLTGDREKAAELVVDDRPLLWSLIEAAAPGRICLVADNAGRELLPDLVLADHLLVHGLAGEIVLHVKPYPYFVSDATPADVLACLRRLAAAPGRAGEAGGPPLFPEGGGPPHPRGDPLSFPPPPVPGGPGGPRGAVASAPPPL